MINQQIKTEEDYNLALSKISALMDAEIEGSPEADELERLASLVEIYEDEHYPVDSPDPAEMIKFRLDQEKEPPQNIRAR